MGSGGRKQALLPLSSRAGEEKIWRLAWGLLVCSPPDISDLWAQMSILTLTRQHICFFSSFFLLLNPRHAVSGPAEVKAKKSGKKKKGSGMIGTIINWT